MTRRISHGQLFYAARYCRSPRLGEANYADQFGLRPELFSVSWLGLWDPPQPCGPSPPGERASLPLAYHPVPR